MRNEYQNELQEEQARRRRWVSLHNQMHESWREATRAKGVAGLLHRDSVAVAGLQRICARCLHHQRTVMPTRFTMEDRGHRWQGRLYHGRRGRPHNDVPYVLKLVFRMDGSASSDKEECNLPTPSDHGMEEDKL
jgi:hypothetical protein